MPAMSGTCSRMDRMNSDNRKRRHGSCTEIQPALVKMGAGLMKVHAELPKLPVGLSVFALGWGEIEGWDVGFEGRKLGRGWESKKAEQAPYF